jgi:hypothetical protein
MFFHVGRKPLFVDIQRRGDISQTQDTTGQPLIPLTIRRYHQLLPNIADLYLNVPPPVSPKSKNLIDKLSAKDQARRASKKESKMLKRQLKHDARQQLRAHRGIVGNGEQFMLDPVEEVKSNAMAYDDSAGATSESESDSDDDGSVRRMARKTGQADEKASKINARYEEKLRLASSEDKKGKLEKERGRELDKVEKEWSERRARFEKAQKRKSGKRMERNGKRIEKAGKRLERLQWIVVVNRDSSGPR